MIGVEGREFTFYVQRLRKLVNQMIDRSIWNRAAEWNMSVWISLFCGTGAA